MGFLLRCIICLGVLYAMILRHDGYLVDPARLAEAAWAVPRQAGATIAASAGPQIAARVEGYCRAEPEACMSAATAAVLAGAVGAASQRKGRVSLGVRAP